MIEVRCQNMAQYRGTPFGVLELRGYRETPDGVVRFGTAAAAAIEALRSRHAGRDRKALVTAEPALAAYASYYKRFNKTYHVQAQIESVLGGRALPAAGGLVQALLLTEVTSSLLIAGLDAARLQPPLTITAAAGGESYLAAGDRQVEAKLGDICLTDRQGIAVSIIYGQGAGSRMSAETGHVLFLFDGVPGVERAAIAGGLDRLAGWLRLLSPEVEFVQSTVVEAD